MLPYDLPCLIHTSFIQEEIEKDMPPSLNDTHFVNQSDGEVLGHIASYLTPYDNAQWGATSLMVHDAMVNNPPLIQKLDWDFKKGSSPPIGMINSLDEALNSIHSPSIYLTIRNLESTNVRDLVFILNNIHHVNRIHSFNLSGNSTLDVNDLTMIMNCFNNLVHLKILNISSMNLTDDNAIQLSNAFLNMSQLEKLIISSNNKIGNHAQIQLMGSLIHLKNLTELNIKNMKLTDEGIKALGKSFQSMPQLLILNMMFNKLSEASEIILMQSLSSLKNLTHLNVGLMFLKTNAIKELLQSLKNMPFIEKLELMHNSMNADMQRELMNVLMHLTHLTEIDLSNTDLNHEFINDFIMLLKSKSSIKKVFVRGNVNISPDHKELLKEIALIKGIQIQTPS
jgi:Ran GTPase-activating protein (RanGAP) involved in mRNA processing and transport